MNPRNNFIWLFPALLGLLFGPACVVAGYLSISKANRLSASGAATTGTVLNVDVTRVEKRDSNGRRRTTTEYRATIGYSVPGEGEQRLRVKKNLTEGETVKVTYDPDDPSSAVIGKPSSTGGYVGLGLGLLLMLGGGLWAGYIAKRRNEIEGLIQQGERVRAKVIGIDTHTSVDRDRSRRYGGSRGRRSTSYVVHCEADPNDRLAGRKFSSERLFRNPGEIHGASVTVFVDPQKPDLYWVDVFGEEGPPPSEEQSFEGGLFSS